MNKKMPFLIIFFLIMGFVSVSALPSVDSSVEEVINWAFDEKGFASKELKEEIAKVNGLADSFPALVKGIFGNETINATVFLNDGNIEKIGIKTRNLRIVKVQRGHFRKPSLLAETTEETLREIIASNDISAKAIDAINSGKINYEGVDFVSRVKVMGVKIIHGIFSFLGNVTGKLIFGV